MASASNCLPFFDWGWISSMLNSFDAEVCDWLSSLSVLCLLPSVWLWKWFSFPSCSLCYVGALCSRPSGIIFPTHSFSSILLSLQSLLSGCSLQGFVKCGSWIPLVVCGFFLR